MTAVLTSLAELTDDELGQAYDRAEDDAGRAAVLAELGQRDARDRMAKARRALDKIRHEAECAVQAQFLAASDACAGRLLSRAGVAAGVAERDLWRMPAGQLARLGSEELNDHFAFTSPRITVASYVRQHAAESRAARIDALDQAEVPASAETTGQEANHEHDQHVTGGPRLAHHVTSPLRRQPVAEEASQAGGRGTVLGGRRGADVAEDGHRAEAATRRPDGHARAAERGLTMAEKIESYMSHGRDLAAGQLARAGQGASVAVREGVIVPRGQHAAVPGDQLLNVLRQWIGTYATLPPVAADAITLWIAHTHVRDAEGVLVWGCTPRLFVLSSEPGSGKTRVLELLDLVCPATHGVDVEPSGPGMTYSLGRERSTLLLDEVDVLLGRGRRHEAVRAIANAGYRRRGTVLNGTGAKATRVSVFGALAMAGLDVLETATGDTLKALLSRGIKIRMRPALGAAKPARLCRGAEDQAARLKGFLEAWAAQERGRLAEAVTDAPEGVEGRAAEIWEPLLSVADAAGGEWPGRARAACLELALAVPGAGDEITPADELDALAALIGASAEDEL